MFRAVYRICQHWRNFRIGKASREWFDVYIVQCFLPIPPRRYLPDHDLRYLALLTNLWLLCKTYPRYLTGCWLLFVNISVDISMHCAIPYANGILKLNLYRKQDHLRMNVAPDLNNHLWSINMFRSMIIKKNRSKVRESHWIVIG